MNIRISRWTTASLVVASVLLTAAPSLAVFFPLGPSKDEWGLKYDVTLTSVDDKTVNVAFTLADEGRLKSIYSATVVAFSLRTDSSGGRAYDVKAKIEFKPTADGKRAGQVQIGKEFVERAMIRILTLNVDGKRQTAGAAYYDIPLKTFLNKSATAASPPAPPTVASPPDAKVIK